MAPDTIAEKSVAQPTVTIPAKTKEAEILEMAQKAQADYHALVEGRRAACEEEIKAALQKYGMEIQVAHVPHLVPVKQA